VALLRIREDLVLSHAITHGAVEHLDGATAPNGSVQR
jgi:hypothetical protein